MLSKEEFIKVMVDTTTALNETTTMLLNLRSREDMPDEETMKSWFAEDETMQTLFKESSDAGMTLLNTLMHGVEETKQEG